VKPRRELKGLLHRKGAKPLSRGPSASWSGSRADIAAALDKILATAQFEIDGKDLVLSALN